MTYPHAGTQSATLPYIKLQISSAGRSVGIIYTMIDCKFYVHIDWNATHIILHHYIATSYSITATRHAEWHTHTPAHNRLHCRTSKCRYQAPVGQSASYTPWSTASSMFTSTAMQHTLFYITISPHRTRSLQPDMLNDIPTRRQTVGYIAVHQAPVGQSASYTPWSGALSWVLAMWTWGSDGCCNDKRANCSYKLPWFAIGGQRVAVRLPL